MRFVVLVLGLASFACGATPHRDAPAEPTPGPSCTPAADGSAPSYGEL